MSFDEKIVEVPREEEISTRDSNPLTKKGHNDVILQPYPSDDPRDPLVSTLTSIIQDYGKLIKARIGQCAGNSSSSP
jgi:hypothetical protein